ncbi:iron-sulfur cluster carrier protein ApbC [Hydrogenovibrio halophilus]|uniref:iron-sulfur cluster carrier protein ApbC n=1 Tax=Hydrogenovibrio halophilus TaxID=373391 RepID=UPI000379DAD8|nr:iron-sulfur cluster carrier protein ApbC [Hydrogenovibrio halophilus]
MNILKKLFGDGIDETMQTDIAKALNQVRLDDLPASTVHEGLLKEAQFKKGNLTLTVTLPFAGRSLWDAIAQQIRHHLQALDSVKTVTCQFETDIKAHETGGNKTPLAGVKNIIAVASGKGGVGKSTTSVNLALALQQEGARVGLLDADIYGPSIPTMLGVHDKPETKDGKQMEPILAYDLQVMSIGFLIKPEDPMIWRGPIVTSTLMQLLNETRWQDLDVLVIDLPPGTGDVQLTMAQQIPVTGGLIVTTPQEVALIDARKGLRMFEKVNIPILGVIENMSTHICENCGHEEAIFGEGGGKSLAKSADVTYLGGLPLARHIREEADQGHPTVVESPTSPIAQKYRHIVHQIGTHLAQQKRSYAHAFPSIQVENT